MKILQLAKFYPPALGGMESFVRDLSHAFVAEGHTNLVLAHQREKTESPELSGSMGKIIKVPSFGEVMYAPIAPAFPFQLYHQIAEFEPDVLLVHMPNVSGFWPLFMKLPCPVVIYWHSDVIFPKGKLLHNIAYKGYSFFEKALLQKANAIVATSKAYLDYSAPLHPFKAKCTAIPLGIDINRIPQISDNDVTAAKQKFLGNAQTKYIYAAGRFAHYKGFDRLVLAAAEVKKKNPDVRFVIAGDGEVRHTVLKLIETLDIKDHVICPGKVSDKDYWALMKGCELFCLPSVERTEAFGIVLLEAMYMGKPCIGTDIPGSGTAWVTRQAGMGTVIKPDDVKALTHAINSHLSTNYPGKNFQHHCATMDIRESVKAIVSLISNDKP